MGDSLIKVCELNDPNCRVKLCCCVQIHKHNIHSTKSLADIACCYRTHPVPPTMPNAPCTMWGLTGLERPLTPTLITYMLVYVCKYTCTHTNTDTWGGPTPAQMRPGAQTQQQPEIQANQSSASNHKGPPQPPSTPKRQPRLYLNCGHPETTIHSWLSHITQSNRVELSPSRCVMEQTVGDQRDWTSSEYLRRQIWN